MNKKTPDIHHGLNFLYIPVNKSLKHMWVPKKRHPNWNANNNYTWEHHNNLKEHCVSIKQATGSWRKPLAVCLMPKYTMCALLFLNRGGGGIKLLIYLNKKQTWEFPKMSSYSFELVVQCCQSNPQDLHLAQMEVIELGVKCVSA